MNLNALAGLHSRTSAQTQQRQAQAALRCQQGFIQLEKAATDGDPQALQVANEALYAAIQLNPNSAKAHFGIARLYLLSENPARCEVYLREVLRLDPHHSEAQALLEQLSLVSESDTFQLPDLGEAIDYDQLYEQITQQIDEDIQRLAKTPPFTPQADREHTATLRDQLQQEQQHMSELQAQLQQLEQELDTTALHTRLAPYETWLHRLETTVEVSGQMLMIKSRIDREQAKVIQLMQQLHSRTLSHWENQLEALLDSCDHIADDLDPLDEHYDLSSLTPAYHQLVAHLQLLQEQID
jgi:tetratricopeptide (TPR) repeat protein